MSRNLLIKNIVRCAGCAIFLAALLGASNALQAEEVSPVDVQFVAPKGATFDGEVQEASILYEEDGSSSLLVDVIVKNTSNDHLSDLALALVLYSDKGAVATGEEFTQRVDLKPGESIRISRTFPQERFGIKLGSGVPTELRATGSATIATDEDCPPLQTQSELCDGWRFSCEARCNNPLAWGGGVAQSSCGGCELITIDGCLVMGNCQGTCICNFENLAVDPGSILHQFTDFSDWYRADKSGFDPRMR